VSGGQSRLGWDNDKPLKEAENAQCQMQGATPCPNLVSWAGGDKAGMGQRLDPGEVVSVELACAAGHKHGYWVIADAVGWDMSTPLKQLQETRCKRRLDTGALCDDAVIFTGEVTRGALTVDNAPKPGETMEDALTCGEQHTEWYYVVKPAPLKPDGAK
jgi:hypothetical protein